VAPDSGCFNIPPDNRPISSPESEVNLNFRTIGLFRISKVRGHFRKMASHIFARRFYQQRNWRLVRKWESVSQRWNAGLRFSFFSAVDEVAQKKIPLSGPSKANGNGNQVLETGKIRRSDCAWGQSFEAAPSEDPFLQFVVRVMLHVILSRGSNRFRGFLNRSTYTSCGSIYGHFE
jgi:hypothetical protein